MQRSVSKEHGRQQAFENRVHEQDARAAAMNDSGLNMRGGSPATQALAAEMKSRDLGNYRSTVMNAAMGTKKKKKSSRPATQASVASFGFDGPDALKSGRAPTFIPKLQTGMGTPFASPPGSRGAVPQIAQVGMMD